MLVKIGLVVLGVVAGCLGGLFGIGGGLVMVPALTALFGMDDRRAVGTSLATILLPVGITGVIQYARNGNVDWGVALWMGLGFLLGAFLGATFANQPFLTKNQFKVMYAIFLIVIAAKYLWDVFGAQPAAAPPGPAPAATSSLPPANTDR